MKNEFDMKSMSQVILNHALEALRTFSQECPAVQVSFFAISVDYVYGTVTYCVDTYSNGLQQAKQYSEETASTWDNLLVPASHSMESAKGILMRRPIRLHSPNTAVFAYPNVLSIQLPELELAYSAIDDTRPDPLNELVPLLYYTVRNLLGTTDFAQYTFSSPAFVGIELVEDIQLTVLRIINWPQ